jgi:hypothetical protein
MQAELNGLYTITHDDLREVRPENAAFCIDVRALVGAVGTGGEESFGFEVCSPLWLEQELESDHVVSGRYRLIMKDFKLSIAREICSKADGASLWQRLGRSRCKTGWMVEMGICRL